VKRVALAVLLLALLGVAACGNDKPEPAATPAVEVPAWAKVAPEQIAEARKHGVPVAFENDLGMRFVLIPAGTFVMGSARARGGGLEQPQHQATIPRSWYMQTTEVTNSQYRRWKTTHNSGTWDGQVDGASLNEDLQPAVLVSWRDASAFAAWATQQDRDRTYRLPTEAEWERAVRGGQEGLAYPWGETDDRARRNGIEADEGYKYATPIGRFPPNRYGLHDMAGNVSEWCQDEAEKLARSVSFSPRPDDSDENAPYPCGPLGPERILRGGNWMTGGSRCACRSRLCEGSVKTMVGFRLVSPLPE